MVEPAAYDETRARVTACLEAWRDDRGFPIVERAWRREEIYHGPYVEQAPDLVLELASRDGYSFSCVREHGPGEAVRRLRPREHGGGKGIGMNGSHRRDGLFVLAGPGVRSAGPIAPAEIADVLPTLLALAGLPVPEGLDGGPIEGALAEAPERIPDTLPPASSPPAPYTACESEEIAARLVALGYLEPPP
jgi:predicted AlkP superfamily phosphohydrolase/phosphomutase